MAAGLVAPVGVPDPELVEGLKRRRFTAEYKLWIVREVEACTRPGEIGELLRREGLYSSLLSEWRKQRDTGSLTALSRSSGSAGRSRRRTKPRIQSRSGRAGLRCCR